jgi:hypothetical protein
VSETEVFFYHLYLKGSVPKGRFVEHVRNGTLEILAAHAGIPLMRSKLLFSINPRFCLAVCSHTGDITLNQ